MTVKFTLTNIVICLMSLSACALATSCKKADAGQDKITLSVSIEPQRKMLETIVGDNCNVVTMLAKGANPETFDPSVQQKLAANRSAAYFTTGYLPFEDKLIRELPTDVIVVNTSAGIIPVTGTHSHGADLSAEADPHVWSSFANARIIAANMAGAMCELDPANADISRANAAGLIASIDSLNAVADSRLNAAHAHAFAIWHPSLSYFAKDYSLHQLALGQESKEASIANLKNMVDEAREDSVRVFIYQKEYDSRQVQTICDEIGARLVTIDPLAYDWENELMKVVDELSR